MGYNTRRGGFDFVDRVIWHQANLIATAIKYMPTTTKHISYEQDIDIYCVDNRNESLAITIFAYVIHNYCCNF